MLFPASSSLVLCFLLLYWILLVVCPTNELWFRCYSPARSDVTFFYVPPHRCSLLLLFFPFQCSFKSPNLDTFHLRDLEDKPVAPEPSDLQEDRLSLPALGCTACLAVAHGNLLVVHVALCLTATVRRGRYTSLPLPGASFLGSPSSPTSLYLPTSPPLNSFSICSIWRART